jgi:hypothetical protein
VHAPPTQIPPVQLVVQLPQWSGSFCRSWQVLVVTQHSMVALQSLVVAQVVSPQTPSAPARLHSWLGPVHAESQQ